MQRTTGKELMLEKNPNLAYEALLKGGEALENDHS